MEEIAPSAEYKNIKTSRMLFKSHKQLSKILKNTILGLILTALLLFLILLLKTEKVNIISNTFKDKKEKTIPKEHVDKTFEEMISTADHYIGYSRDKLMYTLKLYDAKTLKLLDTFKIGAKKVKMEIKDDKFLYFYTKSIDCTDLRIFKLEDNKLEIHRVRKSDIEI